MRTTLKHSKDAILAQDDGAPLTEAEKNLARFLKGRPSHFVAITPFREVHGIFSPLIDAGWSKNPTRWKEIGPSRWIIEYPLKDGGRLNLTLPSCLERDRGRQPVRLEFIGPNDPSPPETSRSNTSTRAPASGRFTSTPTVETETIEREPSVELVKLIRFLADREGVADPRRFQFRQNELGTISKATLVGGANTPGPPHQRLEGGRSVPSDRDTPSSVPGQSRASRALAIIRLITLACAGVMAFSPKTADHYHAAILAGIALSRP